MNAELKARLAATVGHTEGLWKIIWHGNEAYPYPLSIHTQDDASWVARDGEVSSKTNALLIALAPELKAEVLQQDALIGELVEALKSLSAIVDLDLSAKIKLINPPSRWTLEMIDANDKARAMLAKAKEQS